MKSHNKEEMIKAMDFIKDIPRTKVLAYCQVQDKVHLQHFCK
jgi:hypothetical protein